MSDARKVCLHCQQDAGPPHHFSIFGADGVVLSLCKKATEQPVCPMCCASPCRCTEVFSRPGSQPPTYPAEGKARP